MLVGVLVGDWKVLVFGVEAAMDVQRERARVSGQWRRRRERERVDGGREREKGDGFWWERVLLRRIWREMFPRRRNVFFYYENILILERKW